MLALAIGACGGGTEPIVGSVPATDAFADFLGVDLSQMVKLSNNLYFRDLIVGTGPELGAGAAIVTSYKVWLANGVPVDTKTSFPFTIGMHMTVDGVDVGVVGMRVGGKRKIVVGSALAYGVDGAGCKAGQQNCVVPPNTTVVFDITVISAK